MGPGEMSRAEGMAHSGSMACASSGSARAGCTAHRGTTQRLNGVRKQWVRTCRLHRTQGMAHSGSMACASSGSARAGCTAHRGTTQGMAHSGSMACASSGSARAGCTAHGAQRLNGVRKQWVRTCRLHRTQGHNTGRAPVHAVH